MIKTEIKKTYLGTDYSVWLDGKSTNERPDFWVDPQYGTITSDDNTTPPDGLLEAVREFVTKPIISKPRNLEAEIENEIDYEKHTDRMKKAMWE